MQPVPTYETVPVLFDSATKVAIPSPTSESGYAEGVTLPTEHFSWLENKVTKKIDQLAATVTSLITEMDNYLVSRSVTPSGSTYNQFLTALATQIANSTVANATNAVTAATATNALACSGNSSTATTSSKVAGIDPVNGNAGIFSDDFISINPSSSYIIPKGTYVFSGYNNSATGAGLQILNTAGNTWYPSAGNNTTLQGMIISDGINYRIYNWSSNSVLLFYRKLA